MGGDEIYHVKVTVLGMLSNTAAVVLTTIDKDLQIVRPILKTKDDTTQGVSGRSLHDQGERLLQAWDSDERN